MAGDPQNCDSKTWMYSTSLRSTHRSEQGQLPHTSLGQGTYCKKIVGGMPDGPWPKTMVPAVCLGFVRICGPPS